MSEVHESVAEALREISQRYTAGRRALVDVLAVSGRPMTIPDIVAAVRLPQSTAYRNLAVLEAAGAVRRVQGSGDFARYELAEGLTEHHHHLVCLSCGVVRDYTIPARLERALAQAIDGVAEDTGFRPEHHRLDLEGRCADCE